jgi:hypothetical protein
VISKYHSSPSSSKPSSSYSSSPLALTFLSVLEYFFGASISSFGKAKAYDLGSGYCFASL